MQPTYCVRHQNNIICKQEYKNLDKRERGRERERGEKRRDEKITSSANRSIQISIREREREGGRERGEKRREERRGERGGQIRSSEQHSYPEWHADRHTEAEKQTRERGAALWSNDLKVSAEKVITREVLFQRFLCFQMLRPVSGESYLVLYVRRLELTWPLDSIGHKQTACNTTLRHVDASFFWPVSRLWGRVRGGGGGGGVGICLFACNRGTGGVPFHNFDEHLSNLFLIIWTLIERLISRCFAVATTALLLFETARGSTNSSLWSHLGLGYSVMT